MKRAILAFLMLLMLTPGLACAMPSCQHGMGGSPCPHHMGKGAAAPMLMQDCAKAELQKAPDCGVVKPGLSGQGFTLAAAILPPGDFNPAARRSIRGPPPDWPAASQTQPPVILTTQRFRE